MPFPEYRRKKGESNPQATLSKSDCPSRQSADNPVHVLVHVGLGIYYSSVQHPAK
jgi:hypothetical protein